MGGVLLGYPGHLPTPEPCYWAITPPGNSLWVGSSASAQSPSGTAHHQIQRWLVVTVSLSSVLSSPGVTCCCAPGPPRAEPSLQQQKPEQQQDQARHAQADEILHGVVLGLGGCRRREG